MTFRMSVNDPGFAEAFDTLVNDRREADADVSADVKTIIRDVRDHGDAAVARLTSRFDGHDLEQTGWRVDKAESAAALEELEASLRVALELAALRIRDYHEGQLPENRDYKDEAGVRIGARWNAVERAGIYIPGGRAAYPSGRTGRSRRNLANWRRTGGGRARLWYGKDQIGRCHHRSR